MLSPIEADVSRLHFVNEIIENGETAFGERFLEQLNNAGMASTGRPLQKIHDLVIRPSVDLGVYAGEHLHERAGSSDISAFRRFLARSFGGGAEGKREADLSSYLLFDHAYTRPLTELGYSDAKAQQEQLAAFFSDEPLD